MRGQLRVGDSRGWRHPSWSRDTAGRQGKGIGPGNAVPLPSRVRPIVRTPAPHHTRFLDPQRLTSTGPKGEGPGVVRTCEKWQHVVPRKAARSEAWAPAGL